jgi:DNA-binding CsgD family transcriptional regulator
MAAAETACAYLADVSAAVNWGLVELVEAATRCGLPERALADLTAQEAQIAKLARSGHTNQEIGGQLFIGPRTVEWHLGNVFANMGISSRKDLR